jgi:glycosyltransferase involved in cell wall biosynthesis
VSSDGKSPAETRSAALVANSAFSLLTFRGDLIRALAERGVTVFALAPDFDAETRAGIVALGGRPVDFTLSRTGLSPLRDGLDLIRLSRLLRRLRPDVVLSYFLKPVVYGTIAAAMARVPRRIVLLEGLGYYFTSGGGEGLKRRLVRRVLRLLLRTAFRLADRILFLNPDDAAFLSSMARPEKVRVMGAIGVDLARFPSTPVPEGPPAFVMVARLLREKGVHEYVEAARSVSGASFAFVGGLDENPGGIGADQAASWQAEGVIDWAGQVADVRPWLARASVFVLPSWREGVPRSTQEAMAMGRAVITTDAPGCRETVADGVNGLVVPVRDVAALAAAMRRFVDEPGLAARMGRESRRIAEEKFDVRRANAVLLEELLGAEA